MPLIRFSSFGPSGSIQIARVYNNDVSNHTYDLVMTENPAGSGQFLLSTNQTLADNVMGGVPVEIEVRQTSASTSGSFDSHWTAVSVSKGELGWVIGNAWVPSMYGANVEGLNYISTLRIIWAVLAGNCIITGNVVTFYDLANNPIWRITTDCVGNRFTGSWQNPAS